MKRGVGVGVGVGVLVFILILRVGVGCGIGSDGVVATRGSQCDQILQELCARATDSCQLFPPDQVTDCIEAGLITCCAGNCSAAAVTTQQQIDACLQDIDLASCATLDMVAGGPLPATCRRLFDSVPTP